MKRTLPSPFLPPSLADALRAVSPAGGLYVVGGYVRDRLLGRATRDVDVVGGGDPRAVANRLGRALGGHVFALSQEHGAWRVTLPSLAGGVEQVDVAAMRGSIQHDLAERDFTINALAVPPDGGELLDPFDGVGDLDARTVRLVSPDAVHSDPIRVLRAVRHAVELDFTLDGGSAAVITRDARLVDRTAGERQRDELMRVFDTARGADGVRLLDVLGLLDVVLPELTPARGCEQPKEHYWDVLGHSIETVAVLDCILATEPFGEACTRRRATLAEYWPDRAALMLRWDEVMGEGRSRRAVLKLIGLLHDVSKPETRSVQPDGRTRFFGHPERGAVTAAEVFRRLRFSAREVKLAELLIREHLRQSQHATPADTPTFRAISRLVRATTD